MKRLLEILTHCDSASAAFPFGFVVDQDLRLVEMGRSLPTIVPEMQLGSHLESIFDIDRPRRNADLTFSFFEECQGKLILLKSKSGTRLRAECYSSDGCMGFNSTPVLNGLDSLEKLGLSFADFPIIDGVSDSIFNLSMQQQTLREAERIALKLATSNAELRQEAEIRTAEIRRREMMEREQARLNEKLVAASREAGKAEIATGVLHNVGNVMNSVNVTSDALFEKLRERIHKKLDAAISLLDEHRSDLPRFIESEQGQHFVPFLGQLRDDTVELMNEVQGLRHHVDHVNSVVAAQQSFATTGGVQSLLELGEVVDAAIQITSETYRQHGIEVVKDYQVNPQLLSDKQKLIQVLVNLLRNAKHAIEDSASEDQTVSVRITAPSDQEIAIEVHDTGIGISPENLKKIFQHGFTTRKGRGGHGFGLHHSFFTLGELGGRLEAHSPGLGKGASFIAILPLSNWRQDD